MTMGLIPAMRRAPPSDPMILVIDTTLSAGTGIRLDFSGTVDCTVDWGDSTSDSYTTTGDKTHTYGSEGVYEIRITGTLTGFGANTTTGRAKWTQCTSFGEIGLTSLGSAFRNCSNLTVVPAALPSTSTVTDLNSMFRGATSINSANLAGWDVSSVTDMLDMFHGATAFNQDLGAWDVSSVTRMSAMFVNTAFNGAGLDQWDISGINNAVHLDGFATGCTFSTANYDALLIAWEANKASYRDDLSPNFGNSTYTGSSAASTARAALVTYGWTITDGGTA